MNKDIKSLYIHIPFCENICNYCDFPKLQYFTIFVQKYLKKLEEELASYNIKDLKTIYIGGGTPTSLSDEEFKNLLDIVSKYSNDVEEYTVEANPESLSISKLQLMKKYGVNRLSIGVESTNDQILQSINRHHSFLDVIKCIENAKQIGFDNINVDLIIGLPNVTPKMLEKDIFNILSLGIQHISCYSLTVHEHTIFGMKNVKEPGGDIARELYDLVNEKLTAKGFVHYEISNWCKPDYQSKHNLTYWKNEQYYGCGLGASGYIGDLRYTNTKSINSYIDGNIVDYKEFVSLKDNEEYYILLNLRTMYGIDLSEFSRIYNKDIYKEHKEYIDECISKGILEIKNDHLICTYEGMMTLDQVIINLF